MSLIPLLRASSRKMKIQKYYSSLNVKWVTLEVMLMMIFNKSINRRHLDVGKCSY